MNDTPLATSPALHTTVASKAVGADHLDVAEAGGLELLAAARRRRA